MGVKHSTARLKMAETYLKYESQYRQWTVERTHYINSHKAYPYCSESASRERLWMFAKKLLAEFPKVSFIEAHERIGGDGKVLWSLGLWKSAHDPYWDENQEKWRIYVRLRLFPEEIEHALLRADLWAQKLMVPTEAVEVHIPEILKDIADGVVW